MTLKFVEQKNISSQAASEMVIAAVLKAEEIGVKINVSVCDTSGIEIAFLRMNGAFIHSISIAKDKAYTSASFGFSTSQWGEILKGNDQLEAGIVRRDRLVTFGGGLPIESDGDLLGGVGVSGGSEEEDGICAQAGLDAVLLK
ncbi:MAG: heme-binding protein [Gammaproteobacteria bacterium]|nr:MAG: heme-binding protein [Gammaproteobacteria bacterium]RLA24499.1 MAG: heme-binding protein [Gammaproteobacteria bacterium]